METKSLELLEILKNLLQLHQGLSTVAEKMNTALKNSEVETVQLLTAQFDEYVEQIEQTESQRLVLCDSLVKVIHPKSRHITLGTLIPHLPDTVKKDIIAIRNELKHLMNTLVKINTSNQILLEESLYTIKTTFNHMTTVQNKLNGYGKKGTIDTQSIRRYLVNQKA